MKLYGNPDNTLHNEPLEIWVDSVLCGTTTTNPTSSARWYGVLCNKGHRITGSKIIVK